MAIPKPVRIIIPGRIVPKARPRTVVKGSKTWVHTEQRYRECLERIAVLMRQAAGSGNLIEPPIGLMVMIWKPLNPTARRKKTRALAHLPIASQWRYPQGDVDNLIGTIMDAGQGILWQNDNVVYSSWVGKGTLPQGQGEDFFTEVIAFRMRKRPATVWPRLVRFCLESMTGVDPAYTVDGVTHDYQGWDVVEPPTIEDMSPQEKAKLVKEYRDGGGE